MEIIDYNNHNALIPFYSRRGIEELIDYPNQPIKSYVVKENNNIIGAATCSNINEYYILEAIAIDEDYINQGLGTMLLDYVIDYLRFIGAKEVIINAKNTKFFEKNGFLLSDRSCVPVSAYSYCKDCEDYGKTCFPSIMKRKI